MKKLFYNRKLVITIFVVLIVLLTAVAIGPMVYSLLKGAGVKTEPVSGDGAKAASTELDGTWEVAKGRVAFIAMATKMLSGICFMSRLEHSCEHIFM